MKAVAAKLMVVLGVVATGLGSGGCSGRDNPGHVPSGSAFDIFLNEDLGFINYAQQRIRDTCMGQAGYTNMQALIVPRDYMPFSELDVTPSMFGFVSEADARAHGVGRDAPSQPGKPINIDANFEQELEKCDKDAWQALGADAKETVHAYYELGNALLSFRPEISAALPKDLPRRFLDCMEREKFPVSDREAYLRAPNHQAFGIPLGKLEPIAGEPDAPSDGPSASVIPARRYVPTAQESELAAAMFRCQQEVHVVTLSMDAATSVQQRLVKEHEATFLALNPGIEALARRAAELVGE